MVLHRNVKQKGVLTMSISMLAAVIVAAGVLSLLSLPRCNRVLAWIQDVDRKKSRLRECRAECAALRESCRSLVRQMEEAEGLRCFVENFGDRIAFELLRDEYRQLQRRIAEATAREQEAVEQLRLSCEAAPEVHWRPRDKRRARQMCWHYAFIQPPTK